VAKDLTLLIGYNAHTASSHPQTPWPDLPHPWTNLTGRRQGLTETDKILQNLTQNPTFRKGRKPVQGPDQGDGPTSQSPQKLA
jgi:hypothetical protein